MQNIIEETKDIIKSGTTAIHIAGDDYSQIDEFVEGLACALGFVTEPDENGETKARVAEWNYDYGQVDFKSGEQIQGGGGGKMPLEEFLGVYKTRPIHASESSWFATPAICSKGRRTAKTWRGSSAPSSISANVCREERRWSTTMKSALSPMGFRAWRILWNSSRPAARSFSNR